MEKEKEDAKYNHFLRFPKYVRCGNLSKEYVAVNNFFEGQIMRKPSAMAQQTEMPH